VRRWRQSISDDVPARLWQSVALQRLLEPIWRSRTPAEA
jgi:hypothetical protein